VRAIASSGKSKKVVGLPDWVELRLLSLPNGSGLEGLQEPHAVCKRCNKMLVFHGPRQEDERALGRFAAWHRRCVDPALIAEAVEQASVDRAAAVKRDEWFERRRGRR
jgi:hypothetical protein